MSPKDRDEEKALLESYRDNDQQLKASDEPPQYTPENQDPSAAKKARKKKCLRKLGHHLAIAAIVFFVWQTFFRNPERKGCRGHSQVPPESEAVANEFFQLDDSPEPSPDEFPWPPILNLQECVEWPHDSPDHDREHQHGRHGHDHDHGHHHHERSVESSFSLPVSSDALALFSRGPWSVGHLNVRQGTEETDQVLVNVTTNFRGPKHILNLVQLCKFKREEGEVGVGIVSKKGHRGHPHRRYHPKIRFDIDVILPRSSEKRLEINKFVAWLPVFSQSYGYLGQHVHIDTVGLFGSVGTITVEHLSARNATVLAAVGAIKGNFSTSDSLKLVTARGKIDVNVGLFNDDESGNWTHLDIRTGVAGIKANVSMYTKSSTPGGKFNITSAFSTGSADINTLVGPSQSTVDLTVGGGVGAINVGLHKSFEGKFNTTSSVVSRTTVVMPDKKKEDGKERKISFEKVGKGRAAGQVWWDAGDGDESGKERGKVEIANSFGDITLKL